MWRTSNILILEQVSPNLRGPYATMYVRRPWTVRQYAGFSTAESNAFTDGNLAAKKDFLSLLIYLHTAARFGSRACEMGEKQELR
jgi:methylmalonyl-CoA mutase